MSTPLPVLVPNADANTDAEGEVLGGGVLAAEYWAAEATFSVRGVYLVIFLGRLTEELTCDWLLAIWVC